MISLIIIKERIKESIKKKRERIKEDGSDSLGFVIILFCEKY